MMMTEPEELCEMNKENDKQVFIPSKFEYGSSFFMGFILFSVRGKSEKKKYDCNF